MNIEDFKFYFEQLTPFLFSILAVILFVLIYLPFFFLGKVKKKKEIVQPLYIGLVLLGFSFFGLSIGLLIGLSETPVLGTLGPTLLTFLGGLTVYFFLKGKKEDSSLFKRNMIMSSLGLIFLPINLFLGVVYGGVERSEYELRDLRYEMKIERFKTKLEIIKKDSVDFEKINDIDLIIPIPNFDFDPVQATELPSQ